MLTDNITDEIKKAQQWHSPRYDIDKGLLEAGYEPHEIEAAWQQMEAEAHPAKSKSQIKSTVYLVIVITWLVIALIGMFVFHLSPVIFSSLNLVVIAIANSLKVKKKVK